MKYRIVFALTWIGVVCFGQTKTEYFQKSVLEKDISFFAEKLTAIHPLLLDNAYRQNWEKEFLAVQRLLKDSMTQNQFYLLVSPLLAGLNEAHSNFDCPFDQRKEYMDNGGLSFPFSVIQRDSSIIITEYYGEDTTLFHRGDEILEINGINAVNCISRMQRLTGGNVPSIRNIMIEMNFRSLLWMIYGFEKDYKLLVRDGRKVTWLQAPGITNEQFIRNQKRFLKADERKYSLKRIPFEKTAILTVRSFADLESFCHFSDSAFRIIAGNGIENLIIDIRGNLGGRSIVVDSLMNYLTVKGYSQYRRIETRVSEDLKAYYKEKYPEKYNKVKDLAINDLYDSPGIQMQPHDKKNRFKGRMFLLTDNSTFSAAATFAGIFKEMKLGVIIGQETGGSIEYYGDFWDIATPGTGLHFHIAPKRFIQFGGTDLSRGVMPDFPVTDKNSSVIEYAFELIKNHK